MSLSHRYRNFGNEKPTPTASGNDSSDERESEKLEAFDAGYQAGWDDATKAHGEEKGRVSAELGQNLLDLSFTYQEALTKLTNSLEPVLLQIVEKLLPEVVRAALAARILEQVNNLVKAQLSGPVEIVVHSQNVASVNEIIKSQVPEPFEITGENSLGEGQAFVRIGHHELEVDLDSVVADVSKALNAFFHESKQEVHNG